MRRRRARAAPYRWPAGCHSSSSHSSPAADSCTMAKPSDIQRSPGHRSGGAVTTMSSNAVRSRRRTGASAPPMIRSAMPLRRRSIGRCELRHPALSQRVPLRRHLPVAAGSPSRPAYMAAASASRYASRASSSSRVSNCFGGAEQLGCTVRPAARAPVSPPRLRANSIWARSRATCARWRSDNGASSAIARSSYAAAGAAASRLACAAASALRAAYGRVRCQSGGALEKCCRCCDSAPALSSARRGLQFRRHPSSGPAAALAACHARRSGSDCGSVASASAR